MCVICNFKQFVACTFKGLEKGINYPLLVLVPANVFLIVFLEPAVQSLLKPGRQMQHF